MNAVLHSGLNGRSSDLTEGEVRCNLIKLSLFFFFFFHLSLKLSDLNKARSDFLSSLGHRLSDDPRESSFLFQRLSVSIQRFNSVSAIHSGTRRRNCLTSRDTPRAL